MKKVQAFTLIELLVVVVIIGVLATLATVAISSARARARDAKRISDLKQISTALELYMADENSYPTYVTPGQPMVGLTSGKTYMSKVPNNPTPRAEGVCGNSDYQYSGSGDDYSLLGCVSKDTGGATAGFINYGKNGVVRNDGLVARWFTPGYNSATLARDSSGNGNDFTVNEVALVADHNNRADAAYSSGADGKYLYIPTINNFVIPGIYGSSGKATFNAGFKMVTSEGLQTIIRKSGEYQIFAHGNNLTAYFISGSTLYCISSNVFVLGNWYFVTIVYDNNEPKASKGKLYVNGQKQDFGCDYGGAFTYLSPATNITYTLADPNGTIRYMNGPMDYFDIRGGIVMTQPEITTLYNTWLNQ